jgi:hypothetical protein
VWYDNLGMDWAEVAAKFSLSGLELELVVL